MSKLLYVTANPKPVNESFCLTAGQEFLNAYKSKNPDDEIIELNVYKADIPYIDVDVFSGWGKLHHGEKFDQLSQDEKQKVQKINEFTDQFISADKYVFVTPFWNLSIPPLMKAYIDTIVIAGKTFRYTESGPVGLLEGKKGIHIHARGGIYSEGPSKAYEFGDSYIVAILSFLGVSVVDSIIMEGMAQFPDKAEEIKQHAIARAREIALTF